MFIVTPNPYQALVLDEAGNYRRVNIDSEAATTFKDQKEAQIEACYATIELNTRCKARKLQ